MSKGYAERETFSLAKRLKARVRELAETPMDMNPIRIDGVLLEFVITYCDIPKFIDRLNKALEDPRHGAKEV